jgi:MFS family permease
MNAIKTAFFTSLLLFVFGFHYTFIGIILPFLQKEFGLTLASTASIVSMMFLGALIGSILGGKLADCVGRKKVLLATALIFLFCTLWFVFPRGGFDLIAARFGIGLASGAASSIVPLYLYEISPAKIRGNMVAFSQLMIMAGVIFSFIIGFLNLLDVSWRQMVAWGSLPFILLFLGYYPKMEDSHWKIAKEKKVSKGKYTRIQVIGYVLSIIQQTTGISAIIIFSPLIFQKLGFDSPLYYLSDSLVLTFINFLVTAWITKNIETQKRKFFLLLSLGGMTLALVILGVSTSYVAFGALILYVLSFSFGLGPVTCVVLTEIFPPAIRASAMGYAFMLNWLFLYIISFGNLFLFEFWGVSGTFFFYSVLSLLSFLFCWKCLPETKRT